jgi:hypothetical protein
MSINKEFEILLTYGDLHLPSADMGKIDVLLEIIKDLSPDIILDGGDFLDGDSISKYNKSYDQLASLQNEIDLWDSWNGRLVKVSPKSKKILLHDNHFFARLSDLCCSQYWMQHLNALTPGELLSLKDYGWELHKEYVWKNKIMFIHGDALGGGSTRCPINKSRNMVKDIGYSIVKYHSHTTGLEVITQTNQERLAIQIGAFQDPKLAKYIKHSQSTNWSTSIGIFYLSRKTDEFTFIPILFNNGVVVFNNKTYRPKTV